MEEKDLYRLVKFIVFTYLLCSLNGFHYKPFIKIVIGIMYLRELDHS